MAALDSLDHEILAAINQNEQDLTQMLVADGDFDLEQVVHLLHEVQQVKMEFASIKKWSYSYGRAPAKTLRKKNRKSNFKNKTTSKATSKSKKRDPKNALLMSQLSSTLVALSLN